MPIFSSLSNELNCTMISKHFLVVIALYSVVGSISAFLNPLGARGYLSRGGFQSSFLDSIALHESAVKIVGVLGGQSPQMKAGPAVLEPPVKEKTEETVEKKENVQDRQAYYKKGGWAVRLFNDPFNKREFVSMVLCKICGLSDGQSYQVMMQAHQNGIAIVGRYDFERAELYRDALKENGLVCDMIPVEED